MSNYQIKTAYENSLTLKPLKFKSKNLRFNEL